MSNIFLKKKKKASSDSVKATDQPDHFIDFENTCQDNDDYDMGLDFPLEDDIVNLGSWILINHPNFFTGNINASLRYLFFLVNLIVILLIQLIYISYFNYVSTKDTVSLFDKAFELTAKGQAQVYYEWIDTVQTL